jgi:urease accessory protein
MLRILSIIKRGFWINNATDTIVLDYDGRHRRRMVLQSTHGLSFLLDLPEALVSRNGDALVLEDGRLIEIVAAPEKLLEIKCASPQQLGTLAWHLGNRHLPVEIRGLSLRLRRDHVIAELIQSFGMKMIEIEAPFEPETGAYRSNLDGRDHHNYIKHHHNHD